MQLTARPRLARLTALALLVALVLGFGQGVGGPPSAVAAPDIGLPFFGVDLSGSDPSLADKAANANAGFASLRVSWAELQPAPGLGSALDATALARTDALVLALRNKGITPVINVGSAPTWAAVNPGGPLLGSDSDYVTFLTALVAHYHQEAYGGVHYWTLWSEPDAIRSPQTVKPEWANRGAWGDDPDKFAAMLKDAYQAVHAADPNAKVILGPLAYDFFYDPPPGQTTPPMGGSSPGFNNGGIFKYTFLDDILKANPSAKGSFDALGINAYAAFAGGWETEEAAKGRSLHDVAAKAAHVRDVLALYNVSVPIFIGESGFSASGCDVSGLPSTPQNQADYAPKLFARGRDAGVQAIAWFTLDESTTTDTCGGSTVTTRYGLMDESTTPRPAYAAYQRVSTLLGSTTRKSYLGSAVVSSSGTIEGYAFAGGGKLTAMVWAIGSAGPLAQVTVANGFTATDENGNAVSASGQDSQGRPVYNITGSPLVLQRADYGAYLPMNYRNTKP